MGILKNNNVYNQKIVIESLKNGKTQEQKSVIDFFLAERGCLSESTMTLAEYQTLIANRLSRLKLKERALAKIALDESEIEEIPPIIMNGYAFNDVSDDNNVWVRVEDGVAMASRYAVSFIFFSSTQIYTYTYKFDMSSDDTWETTQDFFYQDITCFLTQERKVEQINKYLTGCFKQGEAAEKHVYVVNTLEIKAPNTSYSFSMHKNETLEQSIQAAKAMLRERKFVK